MEEFSLEKYLKNPDRKIVTRGGDRSVRIISVDRHCPDSPIVTLIGNGDYESIVSYPKNGRLYSHKESKYDLFFAPEKKEAWVNLYRADEELPILGHLYNTEEEAFENKSPAFVYMTTVKIKWEE